jgi:hypothetical protein
MVGQEQPPRRLHLARALLAITVILIAAVAGAWGRPLVDVVGIALACIIGGGLGLLLVTRMESRRRRC